MKPSVRKWHDITEPYRAEAWPECARLVRAHVDQDPFDTSTRALLASLLVRTHQSALALMQYERLLPMAVGQGSLFRALATQRRLDDLQPAAERHPDRYRAIQDWFRAFVDARARQTAGQWREGAEEDLSATALLDLSPERFTGVAEQASVFPLDMVPQVINEPAGLLWVVYFGRIRWSIAAEGGAPQEEWIAEEGDVIHLPPGAPGERRIEVFAETPAEVLQFDPGIAALLSRPSAPVGQGPVAGAAGQPESPAARRSMPRPDPLAEPTLAVGAPRERRRDTRMTVTLGNRVVLLGEGSDSLEGTIFDVSLIGLGLCFPAVQVRRSERVRPNALVSMEIGLGDTGDRLTVTGRVAWIELRPLAEESHAEEARVGLEFVSVPPDVRTRLLHLLDSSTRSET